MRGRREERIEAAVDQAASAAVAPAVGWAVFKACLPSIAQPELSILALTAALGACALTFRLLSAVIPAAPSFRLPAFALTELEPDAPDELLLTEQVELVLTDADRLNAASSDDELILEDILAELGPDSRVVRLFDRRAMPTPGQLNARIEQHLRTAESPNAPEDASDALLQALTELRRSLR